METPIKKTIKRKTIPRDDEHVRLEGLVRAGKSREKIAGAEIIRKETIHTDELVRLEALVVDGKSREKIADAEIIRKETIHTDEHVRLEGLVRAGKSREKIADAEILKQREQLLHVTRVGKLAEFVSSLAHEISQPLTAILSYAQAGQRMLKDREPEVKEILQYIVNDNQRAAEVIRRLRTLLKKGTPTSESINLNDLIEETVLLITTDVTVRHKVIKKKLTSATLLVLGDRIQLQQVLLNLISNSLEAMEGIADARELVVCTKSMDKNMALIEVKDSGCGIPDENMSKLFTNFFTSKPDGLGMGLSISRSIVEAHGGSLTAKNNPDRGATFYFTLPLLDDKKSL